MWCARTGREIATTYRDLVWLAEVANNACASHSKSAYDVELLDRFCDGVPPEHDEPTWCLEAEDIDRQQSAVLAPSGTWISMESSEGAHTTDLPSRAVSSPCESSSS